MAVASDFGGGGETHTQTDTLGTLSRARAELVVVVSAIMFDPNNDK